MKIKEPTTDFNCLKNVLAELHFKFVNYHFEMWDASKTYALFSKFSNLSSAPEIYSFCLILDFLFEPYSLQPNSNYKKMSAHSLDQIWKDEVI